MFLVLSLGVKYSTSDGLSRESANVEVITTAGTIVGKTINATQGRETFQVTIFYGVPFAQPPIGNLRFKPPLEVKPWVGKRTAFKQSSSCYQNLSEPVLNLSGEILTVSEDCLYLNVWVPKPVPEKAAVMVYIYGGGFSTGSITMYPFTIFAAKQKVIVVSMNYRLNSLGFLYLGNDDCPGNAGLWDQHLALKWVQENIERFGGDPNRVTLFGHSAGAAATGHHLLNQKSPNLFKRAIIQSGSPYNPTDNKPIALMKSVNVARAVGCIDSNRDALIKCLRNVDASKLVEMSNNHVPVFDNEIVFENRRQTIKDLEKKNVVLGTTSDDGAFLVTRLSSGHNVKSNKIFEETLKEYAKITDRHLIRSIKYYYKDHCDEVKEYSEEISATQFGTDYYFTCLNNELADDLSEAAFPTFRYLFNHRPLGSVDAKWVKADHAAELPILLGFRAPAEDELSNRLMNYWGCFAKTGNPNYDTFCADEQTTKDATKSVGIQSWPRYTTAKKERIEITLQSSIQASGALQDDQCSFWNYDYPILAKKLQNNYD